jgi:hypothetical protein
MSSADCKEQYNQANSHFGLENVGPLDEEAGEDICSVAKRYPRSPHGVNELEELQQNKSTLEVCI